MGKVDLHFRPAVPTFDAHVMLGRRHDRPVAVDNAEETIDAMDRAGIDRALVHCPHAIDVSPRDGNEMLMEMIAGHPRLVPQLVFNPTFDNLERFAARVEELGVRSVRIAPDLHGYPFREWVLGPWLEWLAAERIPLWVDVTQFQQVDLHETMSRHPDLKAVLSEAHHGHTSWVLALLRSLPNLHIEISRFSIADGVARLRDAVEDERILFGSRFPDSSMPPMLYVLHHNGLPERTLRAVCAENLERLLAGE